MPHMVKGKDIAALNTALKQTLYAVQVPTKAVRLSDLPMEVLGVICRPLKLEDR